LIRPEKIRVLPHDMAAASPDHEQVKGVVERVQYLGHRTEYRLRIGAHGIVAWRLNETALPLAAGDPATVEWNRADLLVFAEGGDQ
jgi:ABC-type Fe3+/spermidine/putrescine transport system ATPase subunit